MTPRNLVPATPMRFNSSESTTILTGNRVIKGPGQSKDKSKIPLPPGYVDRSAQRRSGASAASASSFDADIFNVPSSHENREEDSMKKKLDFLEANPLEFPSCSTESTENLMNLLLNKFHKAVKTDVFRPNEAFLQFKSIEESKTQPFDPFQRPKKVFRAASSRSSKSELSTFDDDLIVLERVKEALGRLKIVSERNQKYLAALSLEKESFQDNIFPEVGIFDEKASLHSVINREDPKIKAKERLFKLPKSKSKEPTKQEIDTDIFELIAQKPLEDLKEKDEKELLESGGLFGFSNILPKLNRLKGEGIATSGNSSKLTGVYASILNDDEIRNENETDFQISRETETEEYEDDSLYPGYLENDPMVGSDFEADESEETEKDDGKKSQKKRKLLSQREDKEASRIEKLVKSKFGVDLTK